MSKVKVAQVEGFARQVTVYLGDINLSEQTLETEATFCVEQARKTPEMQTLFFMKWREVASCVTFTGCVQVEFTLVWKEWKKV